MSEPLILSKLKSKLCTPISYELKTQTQSINMTALIGKSITLSYLHKITCISCGRAIKKSFFQGFCFPCFQSSPDASECILRPELCKAHLHQGRNPEWEDENHNQEHAVYLAVSSHVKVGITRWTQIPTRWIDQGASQAIVIAKTANRYTAGIIEVFLKTYFSDRTSWQKMLKNEPSDVDLIEESNKAKQYLEENYKEYIYNSDVLSLVFPILENPVKVKSISFDKAPIINGVLTGIKGQYLILDSETVFNVRNHTGYHATLQSI